jgi:hypothetical protein
MLQRKGLQDDAAAPDYKLPYSIGSSAGRQREDCVFKGWLLCFFVGVRETRNVSTVPA